MEFRSGDIYINDVLAWRNPDRSGIIRGVSAHHVGNELWVNGTLVYTHPGSEEEEEEERPLPRKVVLKPRNRVLVRVVKVSFVLLFILIIIWLFR